MSEPHLRLVTDATEHPREAAQLLLRPVIRFVEAAIRPPLCVRIACRRRPITKTTRARAAEQSESFDLFHRILRPRTYGECSREPGPCPWLLCRHHLGADIGPTGVLKVAFPGRDMDQLAETCSLRVAETGDHSIEEIGALMGVVPERISQIAVVAMAKYKAGISKLRVLNDLVEGEWR